MILVNISKHGKDGFLNKKYIKCNLNIKIMQLTFDISHKIT